MSITLAVVAGDLKRIYFSCLQCGLYMEHKNEREKQHRHSKGALHRMEGSEKLNKKSGKEISIKKILSPKASIT